MSGAAASLVEEAGVAQGDGGVGGEGGQAIGVGGAVEVGFGFRQADEGNHRFIIHDGRARPGAGAAQGGGGNPIRVGGGVWHHQRLARFHHAPQVGGGGDVEGQAGEDAGGFVAELL